jgi:hypothetical protein
MAAIDAMTALTAMVKMDSIEANAIIEASEANLDFKLKIK